MESNHLYLLRTCRNTLLISDLSFALPQPLSTSTNSSIKSGDSDSSGSQHRSNIARSLSVGNNSNTVTMNSTVTKPHSLPSNLKTMKIRRTSNNKFYQCIFRIGKLSRGDHPPPSSMCKNIGSRYAKPSPELKCKSPHGERNRHLLPSNRLPSQSCPLNQPRWHRN